MGGVVVLKTQRRCHSLMRLLPLPQRQIHIRTTHKMAAHDKIRVLACFDKFKDSLSSDEVGSTCLTVLDKKLYPGKLETRLLSLSDGGDGFLNSMKKPLQLQLQTVSVTGPLGNPIDGVYGYNKDKGIAVVEMATASELRTPMNTTTKGTGELIMAAYNQGFRHVYLGVGGSATNDGGLGALQAMGLNIKIRQPQPNSPVDNNTPITEPEVFFGRHLQYLHKLELPQKELLPGLKIEIACDVTSPFVGPEGAVAVFSGQKGATASDKVILEEGMKKAAALLKDAVGVDVSNLPGAGAAGGMPGGFVAVMGATLRKGIDFVAEAHGLEDAIIACDLVLTGEGSYDATSEVGKVPSKVIELARKHGKGVVVVCGRKGDVKDNTVPAYDLLSMYPEQESMNNTKHCLEGLLTKHAKSFPVLDRVSEGIAKY